VRAEGALPNPSPADLDVMPFALAGVWLAVPARQVVEVLGARSWTGVPRTRRELPGVLSWHGRAIAVLDLGALIAELPALATGAPRARNLVCSASFGTLAIPIDVVREVQVVGADQLLPASGERAHYAEHEIAIDRTIAPVLDLEKLVGRWAEEGERP
jgi:chemotaxis signal transduction protein